MKTCPPQCLLLQEESNLNVSVCRRSGLTVARVGLLAGIVFTAVEPFIREKCLLHSQRHSNAPRSHTLARPFLISEGKSQASVSLFLEVIGRMGHVTEPHRNMGPLC